MKMTHALHHDLVDIATNKPWLASVRLRELLDSAEVVEYAEKEKKVGTRTGQQNRALHLWLGMVAEELDRHGHTLQNVVEKIQKAEIRPNTSNLKETLWKPYQMAALQKDSTTKLNKLEVDKVYEGLNKFLGENFEIHIPWPADEEKENQLIKSLEKSAELSNKLYADDDYQGPPSI